MKSKFQIDQKKLLFLLIFALVAFTLIQIPVNALAGAKVKFTLFDLFAPISGSFVGTGMGAGAVVLIQIVNLFVHGFAGVQSSSILKLAATFRFLPLIFGVIYFSHSKKLGKFVLVVPILSILIFNLHPIGRSVWYFSLFWLVPVIVYPFRDRFLVLRAMGSTFSAHAVGGAVWIWAFGLPASVWQGLIPVVILERSIFTLGISASFILSNNVLAVLAKNKFLSKVLPFDKRYLLPLIK